jgi:hypothetical protein
MACSLTPRGNRADRGHACHRCRDQEVTISSVPKRPALYRPIRHQALHGPGHGRDHLRLCGTITDGRSRMPHGAPLAASLRSGARNHSHDLEPVSGVEPLTCRLQDGRPFRSTVIPRSPEKPTHLRFRWSVALQHHSNRYAAVCRGVRPDPWFSCAGRSFPDGLWAFCGPQHEPG